MENPATWNEVERIIAEADKNPESIYTKLAEKGFVPVSRQEEVEQAIADALAEHNKAVQQRMVGVSYVKKIYNKLSERGLTGQPDFSV